MSTVEAPTFSNMVEPFNKKITVITYMNQNKIRKEVMTNGKYTWKAAAMVMNEYEVAWTTDHQTCQNTKIFLLQCHTAFMTTGLWRLAAFISKCS